MKRREKRGRAYAHESAPPPSPGTILPLNPGINLPTLPLGVAIEPASASGGGPTAERAFRVGVVFVEVMRV